MTIDEFIRENNVKFDEGEIVSFGAGGKNLIIIGEEEYFRLTEAASAAVDENFDQEGV